jgi:enolase
MVFISKINAREILDSRGSPTVEARVELSDGSIGTSSVPSGASAGSHEALELRDGNKDRYNGRGVLKAVAHVEEQIAPLLIGQAPFDQQQIDARMIELDGTGNKSNIGANSILGVSLAVARAAASSKKEPLYRYLGFEDNLTLPVPMLNILNGGAHARNSTDIQEFMILPVGFHTFGEALRSGVEIYQTLKAIIVDKGFGTNVGDEGGFAPEVTSNRLALEMVYQAIEKSGYQPGIEVFVGLDVAASEIYSNGRYNLDRDEISLDSRSLLEFYKGWVREFHVLSIEDGLDEDDWQGWDDLTRQLGDRVQIVGDDLFTTNLERLKKGIGRRSANAILLKLNQIGTLSETLAAFREAKKAEWGTIISHRSGETEDTIIADLSVALGAGQIKTGAPCRSERVAKYNRLLYIEKELGNRAKYAGWDAFKHIIDR